MTKLTPKENNIWPKPTPAARNCSKTRPAKTNLAWKSSTLAITQSQQMRKKASLFLSSINAEKDKKAKKTAKPLEVNKTV